MDHDPQCLVSMLPAHASETGCRCPLIARVRADQRERDVAAVTHAWKRHKRGNYHFPAKCGRCRAFKAAVSAVRARYA